MACAAVAALMKDPLANISDLIVSSSLLIWLHN